MVKILNDKWTSHPWNRFQLVELVSVDFLSSIKNENSSNETNLISGEIVPEERVWKDIEENGMNEPLLLTVGLKNKTIRLESGNHRIKLAKKYGYTHLPVATFVSFETIKFEANGLHEYDAKNIINFKNMIKCVYGYQEKLSDIYIGKEKIFLKL